MYQFTRLPRVFAAALAGVVLAASAVSVAWAQDDEDCPVSNPACAPGDPGTGPTPAPTYSRITRVVSFGDSYAAGQGAPDPHTAWLDRACSRSKWSGIGQALSELQSRSPANDEFKHYNFTCSGAQIEAHTDTNPIGDKHFDDGGILTPQREATQTQSQIDQANSMLNGLPVDVLTIGIGGNDIGFVPIIEQCSKTEGCDPGSTNGNLLKAAVDQEIDSIGDRFDRLITAIQGDENGQHRLLRSSVRDVFMTLYPDPTQDGPGAFCDNQPATDLVFGWIDKDEARWISTDVIPRLNRAVIDAVARATAARAGRSDLPEWHIVEAPSFVSHGWCADQRWINTWTDSRTNPQQANDWGTAHPNIAGYAALANVFLDKLSYLNGPNPASDSTIQLIAARADRYVEVAGASPTSGAEVLLAQTVTGANSTWKIRKLATKRFTIAAGHDDRCLAREGNLVVQRSCADPSALALHFKPDHARGLTFIEDRATSGRDCLTVEGNSTTTGARLALAPCTNRPDQTFVLFAAPSPVYSYRDLIRWNATDHVSSIDGMGAPYRAEGSLGLLSVRQPTDGAATMLYRCGMRSGGESFSSTSSACEGQQVVAGLGWIYTQPPAGIPAQPVYRCNIGGDHFDSGDPRCEGAFVEGLLGYALS